PGRSRDLSQAPLHHVILSKGPRHANSPPPNVRDLRPDVPEALAQVTLRMMAKRTEDRFASFDELIEALDRIPVRDEAESPGVALMPLDPPDSRPPSSIPEISLAGLSP